MSALKRTLRQSARLVEHSSPYNASVTLVKLEEESSNVQESSRQSKRVKLEETVQDIEEYANVSTHKRSKAKRAPSSSPKKPKPIPQSLATPHPAPERWREVYDAIKAMRSNIVAPVDSMGSDSAQLSEKEPQVRRLQILPVRVLSNC